MFNICGETLRNKFKVPLIMDEYKKEFLELSSCPDVPLSTVSKCFPSLLILIELG
jgi:hypothetical protein